jgi:hypothetical protein
MVLGCHIFKMVITLVTCVYHEKFITCLTHVLRKYLRSPFKKLQGKCKFIIYEGGDVQQVGIIMYLPTSDEEQREVISKRFFEYRRATQLQLWDSFGAHEHWAKIEVTLFSLIFPCASIFYSKLQSSSVPFTLD